MNDRIELADSLRDAGCEREEIDSIVSLYLQGDLKTIEKIIRKCRRQQLERMHDHQLYIDRLDYLSYQLFEQEG